MQDLEIRAIMLDDPLVFEHENYDSGLEPYHTSESEISVEEDIKKRRRRWAEY